MEKICDSYSTGALYDFVSRSENLEEYRNILESLADQKQNWTYIINDIMKERGLSASKMAELCGVSRQSVQKWLKNALLPEDDTMNFSRFEGRGTEIASGDVCLFNG